MRAAISVLNQALLHPAAPGTALSHWRLATQGLDYASRGACPALQADGLCRVHVERQPGACCAVPLEPLWPDRLQQVVLLQRREEAGFLGADCLTLADEGPREDLLCDGQSLPRDADRRALADQRAALLADRLHWGDAVFADLGPALGRQGAPAAGYLTLPMVLVLMALAAASPRCRARCQRYAQRQRVLIETQVTLALARRRSEDRATTEELRRFVRAYEAFEAWASQSRGTAGVNAAATEAYLGLAV